MLTLTGQDFSNVTVYRRGSSDGCDHESWCIGGKVHVRVAQDEASRPPFSGRTAFHAEACDGSCTAAADVRELVKELPCFWDRGDGRRRRTPVHLDGTVRALLRGTGPVEAVLFEDGYCKRDSRWQHFCLDGRIHVKISTVFAWAFGKDEGFIHSVRCASCDGGCKPQAHVDRQVIKLILREIRWMNERCPSDADQSRS